MALYFDSNVKGNHLFPPLAPKFSRNRHPLYREGLLYFNLHSLSEDPRFSITLGEIEELIEKKVSLEIIVGRLVGKNLYLTLVTFLWSLPLIIHKYVIIFFLEFSKRIAIGWMPQQTQCVTTPKCLNRNYFLKNEKGYPTILDVLFHLPASASFTFNEI